jgi:hypothetical protein
MSSPPHEPDFAPTAEARLGQRGLAIWHLLEIAHQKNRSQLRSLRKYSAAPDDGPHGPAVISPRRNRASLAIQDVFGNYIAGFGFGHSLKMSGMNDVIQTGLRMALGCALLIIGSDPSDALAQSRHTDARAGGSRLSFLSEPRSEEQRPDEEMPRATLEEDNKGFDGAWTFTSAGCRHTGSLVALIIDGKIVVRGGSGQVDPDGTLHSVGAGNGMTLSAVGRLSGNTGAGTFNRSDGCVGSWIAIKHVPPPKLRRSGLRR